MKNLEALREKVHRNILADKIRAEEARVRQEGILTHAKLKELLTYDPDTGQFTRNVGKNAGKQAGYQNINGYVYVYVDGTEYGAHRLAWYYVHGKWPDHDIDHKNRVKNDNRIENLRDVDESTNLLNQGLSKANKSGVRGVSWSKDRQLWIVHRSEKGKRIYVGAFHDLEEAATEAKKYYGDPVS